MGLRRGLAFERTRGGLLYDDGRISPALRRSCKGVAKTAATAMSATFDWRSGQSHAMLVKLLEFYVA